MSICSKHRKEDPECATCLGSIDLPEPKCDLVTCSKCNFVYYVHCDTCPKCQKENI